MTKMLRIPVVVSGLISRIFCNLCSAADRSKFSASGPRRKKTHGRMHRPNPLGHGAAHHGKALIEAFKRSVGTLMATHCGRRCRYRASSDGSSVTLAVIIIIVIIS